MNCGDSYTQAPPTPATFARRTNRNHPPTPATRLRSSYQQNTTPTPHPPPHLHGRCPQITVKLGPLLLKTERAVRQEVVGCVFKAAGVCADACEASGGTKMVDKVVEKALIALQRLPSGT